MIQRTALWVLLGALPLVANAAGLNHKYQPKPQNYPVPADNVLWVATDGKSAAQGATGSREKPFSTLKEAADRSQNGTTPTVQVPRPPLPDKKRRAASTCPTPNARITTASCLTARTAPPYKKTAAGATSTEPNAKSSRRPIKTPGHTAKAALP